MSTGSVTPDREAIILLDIAAFGLSFRGRQQVELGDGSMAETGKSITDQFLSIFHWQEGWPPRMITEPTTTVEQLEVFADDLDVARAAAIYEEHGCLVVRGLMKPYIDALYRDIEASAAQALAGLDGAERIVEGWRTPDGTLFLPAPPGYHRDKQIMVLAISYHTSATCCSAVR